MTRKEPVRANPTRFFHRTKRLTERDSESLRFCLIFVQFECFVGHSSAWLVSTEANWTDAGRDTFEGDFGCIEPRIYHLDSMGIEPHVTYYITCGF